MPSTSKRAPNIDSLGIGSNLQHIMRDMHNRIHQDSMLSLFKTSSSASSKTMMRRLEDDDEVNHIKNYFSRSNNNNSENNGHHSNNKQHMRYWIMGIRAYTMVKL